MVQEMTRAFLDGGSRWEEDKEMEMVGVDRETFRGKRDEAYLGD